MLPVRGEAACQGTIFDGGNKMRRGSVLSNLLISSTLLTSLGVAGAAFAQAGAGNDVLQEVVVTATKQSDTVNKVPLSITAVTQAAIEQQGIKTVQDLARTVPALNITTSNVANGANIAIRGISSTVGGSTTAVYLDDVSLQRRTTLGAFSGSGVVFPQLFDLQRVEVLRGPQGDLYGGSAEGGAVRFITPTPSLTSYTGLGRVEFGSTKDGGTNYELGIGVGGPIIPDKLAFRASAVSREDSGYLDHVDEYTGNIIGENTNTQYQSAFRLVFLWKPTDRLSITPSFYASHDVHKDSDNFWQNVGAVTTNTINYTATGAVATGANGPINYTLPGHTYGPYNVFGAYRTGNNCNIGDNFKNVIAPCYRPSPRKSNLTVGSISADYDLDFATAHFTTAYIFDRNKGANDGSFGETQGYQAGIPFLFKQGLFQGYAVYKNQRGGYSNELRLASKTTRPYAWVVGLYSSFQRTHANSHDYVNEHDYAPLRQGVPDTVLYGLAVAANGDITSRDQDLREKEQAVFGEGSFYLGEHFKLIAGGRLSKTSFNFTTALAGSFFGYAVPTTANGGLSAGSQSSSTFLPKFGAQYDFSNTGNVYVTASKGFRQGGVNTGPFAFKCASTFTALGITDTPRTYDPDSLWSYEAGVKARVFDRAQVNASVFYIKWNNVQVNYTLPTPCGFSYTANAGGAVSKGADIQSQIKLFGGLSATVQAAYTNAYYSSAVIGPPPTNSIFIRKGDTLPIPGVTANLGLRYDFETMGHYAAYVRGDFQYTGPYKRGFGPGASSYNPDTYRAGATNYATLRAGLTVGSIEVAAFANNLFNSQDIIGRTGGRVCGDAACTVIRSNAPVFVDTTFRPRTIGIDIDYHY
jgi:iron complex outermembrane receptor protein